MRSTSPTGSTERIKRLTPKKRLIKLLGRTVFWCLVATSKLIGPKTVSNLGKVLGMLYFRVSGRYRNLVRRQMTQALGDIYTPEQIEQMARQVFVHFTGEAFQFFRLLNLGNDFIDKAVQADGLEHIAKALDEGKGCVMVTAHFGNWEVMARKLVEHGFPLSVIARDSDDPGMTGITTRIREQGGYAVFDKDQPIIGAYRKLKNNELLGILPDQNDYDGVEVQFFGKTALAAVGPAVLSLKTGAALIPAFCEKIGEDNYMLTVHERIEYELTGDQEADVQNLTQLIADSLESGIRKNPAQWLWLHDRWKARPEEKLNVSSK